jgi:hypothetical protein
MAENFYDIIEIIKGHFQLGNRKFSIVMLPQIIEFLEIFM